MPSKHTSPSSALFYTTLLASTIMMLTSSSWIMLWMSMEINLISFIPLILSSSQNHELEAGIKYFLTQTIGSSIMLMTMFSYNLLPIKSVMTSMFITSLSLKMGIAPFHLWVPQVLNSISWLNSLLVITWQKIGPLSILSYMTMSWSQPTLLLLAIMNSWVGTWGGMSQTQMRPLIAYSSITHMGWVLASLLSSFPLTITYFTLYTITTSCTIMLLMKTEKLSTTKFNLSSQPSSNSTLIIAMNFLSMGGMPPMLGFIPKWMVIMSVMELYPILTLILITSSLLSLFYYMKIFFAAILNSPKSLSFKTNMYTTTVLAIQIIIPPMITLTLM